MDETTYHYTIEVGMIDLGEDRTAIKTKILIDKSVPLLAMLGSCSFLMNHVAKNSPNGFEKTIEEITKGCFNMLMCKDL